MHISRKSFGPVTAIVAAVSALILTACGSGSGGATSTGASTSAPAPAPSSSSATSGPTETTNAVVEAAKAVVAEASQGDGTYILPVDGPAAVKGKNVWVISCGLAADACSVPAQAVQEASSTLGWTVTVWDGKFTAAEYTKGINQAVAAKADGMILVAIDCSVVKGALEEAKAANIPVVGVYAYDCDTPIQGGTEKLFAATINSNGTPEEWAITNSTLRADYAIATLNGEVKALALLQPDFAVAQYWGKAFQDQIAKCSTCSIVENIDFTSADLSAGTATQKLATALLNHPEANTLFVTSDALLNQLLPAIRESGRTDLLVIANEGFAPTQVLIREGIVDVAVGIYSPWMGWSGADALNRVFAGETDIPNQGLGYFLMTKDTLPASGDWAPSLDFKAAFIGIWS